MVLISTLALLLKFGLFKSYINSSLWTLPTQCLIYRLITVKVKHISLMPISEVFLLKSKVYWF